MGCDPGARWLPRASALHAEVLPSGLVRIADGKTGARQSLAMPADWVKRWQLIDKRLPPTMHEDRGHRAARLGRAGHSQPGDHTALYRRLPMAVLVAQGQVGHLQVIGQVLGLPIELSWHSAAGLLEIKEPPIAGHHIGEAAAGPPLLVLPAARPPPDRPGGHHECAGPARPSRR